MLEIEREWLANGGNRNNKLKMEIVNAKIDTNKIIMSENNGLIRLIDC